MRNYIEFPFLFISGAAIYSIIELLWRGHTHWTMAVAGGLCLCAIHFIRKRCPDVPLIIRCIAGAIVICAVEYATGFIVNLMLKWNVWDYSHRPLNVYGQICPLYAFLWFLLCIPGNYVSEKIEKNIMIPYYRYIGK